jgi:acetolactate synthase-1/2/3 large subunit
MRVSQYIADALADRGVRHVFMLTGGGAMFLNHAIGTHPGLQTVFCLHEQACSMAAEGYARLTRAPGVANVTTGPGGINALNGVYGAWTDSVPLLILSGQVKRETYIRSYDLPALRQLGDQEVDIISMVSGVTKYAVTIHDPQEIRYHLERAWYLAQADRPGPCWLDIPIDVQSSLIEPEALLGFTPPEPDPSQAADLAQEAGRVLDRLRHAERPVILAGTGVRAAGAVDLFNDIIHRLGIPVTTAWTHDLIDSNDSVFCGRPGSIGTRPGNFAVQNSDVLLILGSRLNVRQTGYAFNSFARAAHKIWVDADPAELAKPTVRPDWPIVADLADFLRALDAQLGGAGWDAGQFSSWLAWCRERHARYPAVLPRQREFRGRINPYPFIETLFDELTADDVVVCGNGAATVITFQAAGIKSGMRLWANSGSASMGYDLPAAIGAAFARGGKRVVCLAGDGSLQLNVQELQTVVNYGLPIKLFVLNNAGYLSIRSSQRAFFGSAVGEGPSSGLTLPDSVALAGAYGIAAMRIDGPEYRESIRQALDAPGPIVADVVLDPDQGFEPRQSSRQLPDGRIISAPLEDLYPFLPRAELLDNLLIPPRDPDSA